MRAARQIVLTDAERVQLTKWSGGRTTPARRVEQVQIVLFVARTARKQTDRKLDTVNR